MRTRHSLLLLLAAAIWGFAFVAQRTGMRHVGPFTYTGIRFALGGLTLLPLLVFLRRRPGGGAEGGDGSFRATLPVGLAAGVVLFIAASLQQAGLVHTTAGKAAFVTGLYIVFVPLAGLALNRRPTLFGWIGAVVATLGLYLLCVTGRLTLSRGDTLELLGAVFWTAHLLLIDRYAPRLEPIGLACTQFLTCAVLALAAAAVCEPIALDAIGRAAIPILYGGICSVGGAYTLQVIGQRHVPPVPAAIILSLETVFGALGGFLFLREQFGPRELAGCALMFAGMLLSQCGPRQAPARP